MKKVHVEVDVMSGERASANYLRITATDDGKALVYVMKFNAEKGAWISGDSAIVDAGNLLKAAKIIVVAAEGAAE